MAKNNKNKVVEESKTNDSNVAKGSEKSNSNFFKEMLNNVKRHWHSFTSSKFVRKLMLDDLDPNLGGNLYRYAKFDTKFLLLFVIPIIFIAGIFVVGYNYTYDLTVSYEVSDGTPGDAPISTSKSYGTINNESYKYLDQEIVDIIGVPFPALEDYTDITIYYADVALWYDEVTLIETGEDHALIPYTDDITFNIYKDYASDITKINNSNVLATTVTITNSDGLWIQSDSVSWVLGADSADGHDNTAFIIVLSLLMSFLAISGFLWFHFSIFSEEDTADKPVLNLKKNLKKIMPSKNKAAKDNNANELVGDKS